MARLESVQVAAEASALSSASAVPVTDGYFAASRARWRDSLDYYSVLFCSDGQRD